MFYKEVKNDNRHLWTSHSKYKLVQYNLGPGVVKRVIRTPDRIEDGIAPDTVAVMKDRSTKSQEKEMWVMYQKVKSKIRIISTWIYPGKTKKGKEIFIPDDTLEELQRFSDNFNE
jgi:hypothetical protein